MKKCVLFLALFALFITGCTLPNQTPNSHTHEYVWVVDVNPTVDEVGYKHKECTICNKEIEKLTEIPKLDINSCNHVLVYNNGFEATCLNDGLKQHYKCSKCEKTFEDDKAEKEIVDLTLEKLSHNLVYVDEVNATCLNEGVKSHYKCTKCEKTFEDDKAEKEIVDLTISKSSHNYSEPSYTWSSDNSCCTAIVTCIYDVTHLVKEENIPVETIKSKATCENDGIKVLCVTFKNELFEQQTKEVTYKEPHTFDENGKCVNCAALSFNEYLTFRYVNSLNGYTVWAKDKNVTKVEIPSTYNGKPVLSIGSDAFAYCNNLASITIPNSVTNIGNSAFEYCYSLKNVYYEGSIEDWCNVIFSNYHSNPMYYASHFYIKNEQGNYTELTNLVIPNTVIKIGDYQFAGFNNLTDITITSSVTSIGEAAFVYCSDLTSITIPNSVTNIGSSAFYNCSGLTSITIPNSVTSIGEIAFSGCYKLVEIYNLSSLNIQIRSNGPGALGYYARVIHKEANEPSRIIRTPEGFEFIKDDNDKYYLFNYTGTDTDIVLPNNINGYTYEINDYAFYENSKITSITISNSVTSIGEDAFTTCYSLKNVYYEGSIEDWCNITFSGEHSNPMERASHFYIKNEQEKYTELTNLVIPNTVIKIGDYQFAGFNNLTDITITSSVTSIGEAAFVYCSDLTSITIPNSLTSIGRSAFEECRKLVEIYNLSSLNIQLGSYDNGYIGECAKVIHKNANEPSRIIKTPEGFEFYKDENNKYYLINYTGNETNLTLPSNINGSTYEIYDYAFVKNSKITSITIPSSVTSIGSDAFYYCSNLTRVAIPSSVISIGSYAFYNCGSLTSITIPNSVTSIGSGAFGSCTKLTIYCETPSKPDGWDSDWNFSICPVIWGYNKE